MNEVITSANSDEEVEGGKKVYQLVTTSGDPCERCQAMAGSVWDEPPGPIHRHCQCEVRPVIVGLHGRREDCSYNFFGFEQFGVVHYGPPEENAQESGFKVYIDCWDGFVYEYETWLDIGGDSDWAPGIAGFEDMLNYALDRLSDEASEVAGRVCQPCPELIVS